MKKMICIEIHKILYARFLWFSLLISSIFSVIQIVGSVRFVLYVNQVCDDMDMPHPRGFSVRLITSWLGGDFNTAASIFVFIIPLLAALPYGISYYKEQKSGYSNQLIVRCGKKKYVLIKGIAAFISGTLAIGIPLLLNVMINATYIPHLADDQISLQSFVGQGYFLSKVYYSQPTVYLIMAIILMSVWGGVWAFMAFTFATFVKNAVIITVAPILVAFVMNYGFLKLGSLPVFERKYALSPIDLMFPAPASPNPLWLEVGYILVMLLIMSVVCYRRGVVYETI